MAVSKITIVGAGLGGSLLAIYLARRGYEVHLFELRGDLRTEPVDPGRSIKLTLAERGLAALRELGLEDEIKSTITVPLRGRAVHSGKGAIVYQPYGKNDQEVIYSFSRNDLNALLLTAAERQPNVQIHFNQRCVGLDKELATAHFQDTKTGEETAFPADLVVGADGAYSIVRQFMQRRERADYRQDYLPWGYKEITILGESPNLPPMDSHALHIWPCGDHLLFGLPNFDGSLCGVCVLPFEGRHSFEAMKTDQDILDLFGTHFGDALPYMPNLLEEFKTRPISEFVTVRTSCWHYKDKILLIGDAAHSVVPFYGQGMNAAFEDCTTLDRLLDQFGNDRWYEVLRQFQSLRKPNTDVLAQLSVENFDELRDTARRPVVTARKQISIFLNRLFGQHSVPLYTMVSHSLLPYTECISRHRRQERIARWLGLDLLVGAVSLNVRLRTALSQLRVARLTEAVTKAAPRQAAAAPVGSSGKALARSAGEGGALDP